MNNHYKASNEEITKLKKLNPDNRIKKVKSESEDTYILRGVSKLIIDIKEEEENIKTIENKEIDMAEMSLDAIVNARVDAAVKKAEEKFDEKMKEAYGELEKLKKGDRIGILRKDMEDANKRTNAKLNSIENMGEITIIVNKEHKKKKPLIVDRLEKVEEKLVGIHKAVS